MPSYLRIGVNALYLIPGGVGGTEIYLRNLLAALAQVDSHNDYFVFANREAGAELCPQAPNFQPVPSRVPGKIRAARLLWEQSGLAAQTAAYGLDVLFSAGFTSPAVCRCPKVTVIHDLQHKKQPGNFGWLERRAWDLSVWASVRGSHRLVTPSESSKRDLVETYKVDPAKVDVIRHGVEPDFFELRQNAAYDASAPRRAGAPDCKYLLAVSTLHPHKNWPRLLDAYQRLAERGFEEHLVIAGLAGKSSAELRERLDGSPIASRVHVVGWQPRDILIGLFKYAEALVFPSTFEGFGMPVLEAQAAGLPVACSDIPPLREVAGEGAAYFDPHSAEAISKAVEAVLRDNELRTRLSVLGRENASRFSWRRAAEQTLASFLAAARG